MDERTMARGLGLLSLGAGVGFLAAPRQSARLVGLDGYPQIARFLGLRDLVVGVGLASGRAPRAWVQARMVADTADAVMLATGLVTGAFDRRKAALGIGVAAGFSGFSCWLAGRLR